MNLKIKIPTKFCGISYHITLSRIELKLFEKGEKSEQVKK